MSRADIRRVTKSQTLTFTSGTTQSPVSDAGKVDGAEYVGLVGSTAFGSTSMSFQVGASSSSDASWYDVYVGSTQLTLVVSTNSARFYLVDVPQQAFALHRWMRLVSGSTGEAAGRTWTLLTK